MNYSNSANWTGQTEFQLVGYNKVDGKPIYKITHFADEMTGKMLKPNTSSFFPLLIALMLTLATAWMVTAFNVDRLPWQMSDQTKSYFYVSESVKTTVDTVAGSITSHVENGIHFVRGL